MADINDRTQNVSLHDEVNDKPVTTTDLGTKTLLDVNASSDPTQYVLESDYDATGDVVTSAADATLFSFSGAGVIDFVAITCATSSNWEAIIVVDGTEKFRSAMTNLGSVLGLTGGNGEPIWVQTANKQFRWSPQGNAGFTSGFAIKARAIGANVTLTHITLFRELQ